MGALTVQVLDTAALRAAPAAQWQALSRGALVENPCFSRPFVLATLDLLPPDSAVGAVLVTGPGQEWRGLFPFRPGRFGVAQGELSVYQFSGVPLLRREGASEVVAAWLGSTAGPKTWWMPHVPLDGPFHQMVQRHCAPTQVALSVQIYARPQLTRAHTSFAEHCAAVISRRRLKELRRSLRRLEELGTVRLERVRSPELLRDRLERFLAVEASGWKGARSSAFLSDPAEASFARRVFADPTLASIDSLLLNDEPIAVSLNLHTGGVAYTAKCAYDEAYRSLGPGLLLEYLIIEAFYASQEFSRMDAATTSGGHLIEGLWNSLRPMGTLVVGPRPQAAALAWQGALLHATRQSAKALLSADQLQRLAQLRARLLAR